MICRVVFILLICLCAVICILNGTDYVIKKINSFKRFHIGRWNNQQAWISAVKKTACKWVKHTPIVRKTDNSHHIIIDMMTGTYKSAAIQSWQNAGIILGIQAVNDDICHKYIVEWQNNVLNGNGMWKKSVNRVDFAMMGYALLKTYNQAEKIKPAMNMIINILENNLCDDQMISYSQGKKSSIRFVDTLGMVCPFLALYGVKYNDMRYCLMAYNQIKKFREFGMYSNSAFPCHAYDVKKGLPLGIYGWGRGTAWYLLALIDTYKEFPNIPEKEELKSYIKEAADYYKLYQKEDGGFETIIQGGGNYDSSVTAAMAYLYYFTASIDGTGTEEYIDAADKCIEKLMSVTMKNGAIDQCQGDTHGIGIFSQVYDIMPFVQGLTIKAVMEKEKVYG